MVDESTLKEINKYVKMAFKSRGYFFPKQPEVQEPGVDFYVLLRRHPRAKPSPVHVNISEGQIMFCDLKVLINSLPENGFLVNVNVFPDGSFKTSICNRNWVIPTRKE